MCSETVRPTRRAALAMAAAPIVARKGASDGHRLSAFAFDGFTIFDVRALTKAVVEAVPDKGAALAGAWTNKLFSLSWIETSAGRYSGFPRLADAALAYAATSLGVDLDTAHRKDLVATFDALPAWPDAGEVLERLRSSGRRLALLSNLSEASLTSSLRKNGLDGLMERPISTDRVRAFKPSPRAYAMGETAFGLPRSRVGFVAFGGWDALGAKWFGYPTAWINRLAVPQETLDPAPDTQGRDLGALLRLAGLEA